MSVNVRIQPFTSPDPRRASNRSEPRVYPHRCNIISSPFRRQVQTPSLVVHAIFLNRIASTRDIPQNNSNWLSGVCMTSITLIQLTCRYSPPYGQPRCLEDQGPTDWASLHQCLADLKAWRQSNIPIYSFTEHQRLEETKYLYGASIIISEYNGRLSRLNAPDLPQRRESWHCMIRG